MVTAALSIGSDAGGMLLVFGVIILAIGVVILAIGANEKSDGGVITGVLIGIVGVVMVIFGSIGIGQGTKTLPDFSKDCRGKIELSVYKTERRQDDVKRVSEAIEDDLGCKDAVEEIIQMPFESPSIEASQLEPSPVELVPAGPRRGSGFPGGISTNGGTTAPGP